MAPRQAAKTQASVGANEDDVVVEHYGEWHESGVNSTLNTFACEVMNDDLRADSIFQYELEKATSGVQVPKSHS